MTEEDRISADTSLEPDIDHQMALPSGQRTDLEQPMICEGLLHEKCSLHGHDIRYICSYHSSVGCSDCFSTEHTDCRQTDFIPKTAQGIEDTEDLQSFRSIVTEAGVKTKEILVKLEESLKHVQNNCGEIKESLKKIRKEINEAFDRLEEDVVKEAEGKITEETERLETLKRKIELMDKETKRTSTKMCVKEGHCQNCNSFVTMKKNNSKLDEIAKEIKNIEIRNITNAREYRFSPCSTLIECMQQANILGRLHLKETEAELLEEIGFTCTSDTDSDESCIYASVLMSQNTLIVTDYNNKKVKAIDLTKKQVVDETLLQAEPWGIARVSDHQVAVTIPGEKMISFLTTIPNLKVDRNIEFDAECHGVAYCRGRLFVTFAYRGEVKVVDMTGTVLNTFPERKDIEGRKRFNYPSYITTSPDNQSLFITCRFSNNVVRTSLEGQVLAKYGDEKLRFPHQVAIDKTGSLYVCGKNSIHQLSSSGKQNKVLIDFKESEDRMVQEYPNAISHDEETNRLYVGFDLDWLFTKPLKVFQLS